MRGEINWAAHIEAVARRLCGEPNKQLSHGEELRFGRKGSLRVSIAGPHKGTWKDWENDAKGGVLALISHKLGVSARDAAEWAKTELLIEEPRVQQCDEPQQRPATEHDGADNGRIVAAYYYHDETGQLLYRVRRREYKDGSKTFIQNPPDGNGGWVRGAGCMDGVRRVPYRLPELLEDQGRTAFIVEGEKCADRLNEIGLLATSNSGGCKKTKLWSGFTEFFRNRTVIVLPDNDDVGRQHANGIINYLLPVATEVRLIELPGLPEKGDVFDWLEAGHTKDELIALAEAAEPVREAPQKSNIVPFRGTPGSDTEPPENAPSLFDEPLNDVGNAKRMMRGYGPLLRYVVGIGWHVWDGCRYQHDPATVHARKFAHKTAREMLVHAFDMPAPSDEARKKKEALIKFCIGSGNSNRINNMMSQAEPYLASVADDLDKDPWLLNCANGTVDLRTGEIQPHNQEDLITKLCGTDYDPRAKCPRWEQFMLEIFDGDAVMVEFVQRAIGYSLTGLTHEQVVFIMHGSGSNGKSVLLETIAAVLADYLKRSPADTWVSKPTNGPSNDVAALAGARFVSVVETEHEKQLAEALVKQATGGDAMTARFLHKEFFSFIPKFKLWFATNHKPKIRGSDFAIWRRIILLPFLVTFNDKDKMIAGQQEKDPDLKTKLAEEYPGILAWMIRGCMEWQRVGLKPPETVIHATESYQDSQDNVSGFIRDNCWLRRSLECPVGLLYAAYEIWCEENDEEALTARAFGKNLDERGLPPGPRAKAARKRKGIDLKEEIKPAAALKQAAGKSKNDASG